MTLPTSHAHSGIEVLCNKKPSRPNVSRAFRVFLGLALAQEKSCSMHLRGATKDLRVLLCEASGRRIVVHDIMSGLISIEVGVPRTRT